MLERASTKDIFEALTRNNADKPQQELKTDIRSLDEAMFDLKNVLPMLESQLTLLILAENDESLLNKGMKHCKNCISEELRSLSEDKAHNFITMWKQQRSRNDFQGPILIGEPNDGNLYQRFKRTFHAGDQLDSLLRIHNAYFKRIEEIHVVTSEERQSDTMRNDHLRFGF